MTYVELNIDVEYYRDLDMSLKVIENGITHNFIHQSGSTT